MGTTWFVVAGFFFVCLLALSFTVQSSVGFFFLAFSADFVKF